MLDSQARIGAPPLSRGILPNGEQSEPAAGFFFLVTWSSLFTPLEYFKTPGALEPRYESPLPARNDAIPAGQGLRGSTAHWEMVIPKMVRPNGRAPSLTDGAMPAPGEAPARPPDRPAAVSSVLLDPLPSLARRPPRSVPLVLKLAAISGVLMAVLIPIGLRFAGPRPAPAPAGPSDKGAGSWMHEGSRPAGTRAGRQLILYRPSLGASDGRLEFSWKISESGIAWIFRVKDSDNYYAMALKVATTGASPMLSAEHFTVYQGTEGAHISKPVVLAGDHSVLQIRMDVSGQTFTLYLEGKPADAWSDARLTAGALGFLEEPGRPADVQSVRMSFSPAARIEQFSAEPASGGA